MEHYFSKNPGVKSDKKTFRYQFKGENILFNYDHGVFSMGKGDRGSEILINTFIDKNPSLENEEILDLGTGYGFIGVILKKYYPHINLTMSDINLRAVELAKENIKQNSLTATVLQSDGFEHISKSFHYILFNPPIRVGKEKVYELLNSCHQHLLPGGELWIVVRVKQGAKSMGKYLQSIFKGVETVEREAGYHIIKAIK
ncbi:class I SAM-dependent methyltransferase [Anaerobranca gottschalkii]|uniref:16S rRNA (Guanine1207-N2)-methyltransferase n=1 Tax=Anaerobranca gottschalkii DSM 13577 TaxID=1120990 RepID=A0A1H9YDR6_9FIRM|nr:methyltransferase [Anaerobranca gottschalkii]SES67056.1 16S rRNA (guanine1207-N2)-methyltransferase [Anaerobranca gottschalkii DSM 13577]